MMAAPGNAGAVVVLDQLSYVPAPPPPPTYPNIRATQVASIGMIPLQLQSPYAGNMAGAVQTITAGAKGKLSSVSFSFSAFSRSSGTLILSLIDGDYAAGARSVIGQKSINFVDINSYPSSPNNLNQTFDTSAFNYKVKNGKKFSIVFDTTPDTTGLIYLGIGYSDLDLDANPVTEVSSYSSNYSGGELLALLNGTLFPLTSPRDLTFATYVDTSAGVPEPATWALMILGFGGIGAAMRRRGKSATAMTAA